MIASLSQSVCSRGSTLNDTRIQYSKSLKLSLKAYRITLEQYFKRSLRIKLRIQLLRNYHLIENFALISESLAAANFIRLPTPANSAGPTFKTKNGQLRNRSSGRHLECRLRSKFTLWLTEHLLFKSDKALE